MTSQQWPEWLPLRDDLSALSPYGAPQLDIPVRLNTNENPYSLDEVMQKHLLEGIQRHLEHLNRYPDRDAAELRSALARFINNRSATSFDLSNIWAANGSNEILQSIALAFDGSAIGFEPSYSMHPLICRVVGRKWISVPRKPDFSIDVDRAISTISLERPAFVFLTTPNNPTGTSISLSDIEAIARTALAQGALVIVDEAYAEFSSATSAVTLIDQYPNLLAVRTMSKAFAFAGARVGYLIARPEVIDVMLLVRLPYHLSALTQAAALAATELSEELLANVAKIIESRGKLIAELDALGLSVIPSDSNFLLFTGFERDSAALWRSLVDKGILIRDVGIPRYLRVTVGTEAENQSFISALTSALTE